jgi:hypothetical protein
MVWQSSFDETTLNWLLEDQDPGVRYLAMRDLLKLSIDDPELIQARHKAHRDGPIATILSEMDQEGFWINPGPGYLPKYRSTVWSLILLAQLGASCQVDSRIIKACQYYCDHALTEYGQFSASGTPGSTVDCLQGNMCWTMLELGFDDPRLEKAYDWMARSQTGEGVSSLGDKSTPIRYYSGKCGPGFKCGSNNKLPCAWGATKVMLAFSKLPQNKRTPLINRAIQQGVDFFFSIDPVTANYPTGWAEKPSSNWWKFGFPVFYVTDILQIAEALVQLGFDNDPRLNNTLEFIKEKQNNHGQWLLDYSYTGKTWGNYGEKKQANKWVTLRAARVMSNVHHPGSY